MKTEHVDLSEILADCVEAVCLRYRVPADVVQLDAEPLLVRARAVDLDLVFRNLIDNAVKYAERPAARGDDGPAQRRRTGRRPHQRQRQGHSPATCAARSSAGSSAWARNWSARHPAWDWDCTSCARMVRRLQGTIRVRDREGGPGTTFEVTLPS